MWPIATPIGTAIAVESPTAAKLSHRVFSVRCQRNDALFPMNWNAWTKLLTEPLPSVPKA